MSNIKKAYFAAGCFWGVEWHFEKINGVTDAVSGYMGGHTTNPDYASICTGQTGHLEVVEVNYDENIVSYKQLAILFFEIHDFTQINGQGPDIGSQYLSAVLYNNDNQKETIQELIQQLQEKSYFVATKLIPAVDFKFYKAEDYHQDYYTKTSKQPYCHTYKKVF